MLYMFLTYKYKIRAQYVHVVCTLPQIIKMRVNHYNINVHVHVQHVVYMYISHMVQYLMNGLYYRYFLYPLFRSL